MIIRSKLCNIHRTNQILIFILIVHEFIQSIKWFQLSFIVIVRKSRWIKFFDRPVRCYDPDFKPLPREFFLEHNRPRAASPWFYLCLPRDEALLARMRMSSILAQHFLSICRSFAFTGGLGCAKFWGNDLSRYKYFWLPPQNIWGFEYLEDLVSLLPVKFESASYPSYHKIFYPEYGLAEYDLSPSPPFDLSFAMESNPVDSPTFFMLMIEPAPKKIPSHSSCHPSIINNTWMKKQWIHAKSKDRVLCCGKLS